LLKGFGFYRGFIFGVYVSTNISLWCNALLIHLFSLALYYSLLVYTASHAYFLGRITVLAGTGLGLLLPTE